MCEFFVVFDEPFSFTFIKNQMEWWFAGWVSPPALSVASSPNTVGSTEPRAQPGDDVAEEEDPIAPVAEGLDPLFAVDIVI